ncbi:MAG: AraC family transcriptional regulator [Bacteroidales bacterium]|nr:AraC family transcriptional regulator [Bacteroidales bacterium]
MEILIRKFAIVPLIVFLLLPAISTAQGKRQHGVDEMEKKAYALYQQGHYREACDIYIQTTQARSGEHSSRVVRGLTLFLLVDIIGVLFFLYVEKRKAFTLLVEKNKECATRPVFSTSSIRFAEDGVVDPHEKHVVEQLQQLFEEGKIYLDSELSIDHLSSQMGVSRTVLSKVINQHVGCTFPTLLNHYRINEAIRLLSNSETQNYKMEAISSMSGYNNRQVFHAAFKKETGLTPLEFKKVLFSTK